MSALVMANQCQMSRFWLLAPLCLLAAASTEAVRIKAPDVIRSSGSSHSLQAPLSREKRIKLPKATSFGQLDVRTDLGASMFHMFYEAREITDTTSNPILLWLQGGPGCSSFFGMLYINGPYFINHGDEELTLRNNPGAWNRLYGMLFVEQPIGVGFSPAGQQPIPDDELGVGFDLYRALQSFYRNNPSFAKRPLIVTGESYAGKYVPSLAHFILQADAIYNGYELDIQHRRNLPLDLDPPNFRLGGFAIGNGFTDAETQTLLQAEVAWVMGIIDYTQRKKAEAMQEQIVEYIVSKAWQEARVLGDDLLAFINEAGSVEALEDVRRNIGYDGDHDVDRYLNQPHVKSALGIERNFTWESCSADVDRILGHDMMISAKPLVADLLSFYPGLLYQGQWDAECGYAANDAWISTLKWEGHANFTAAKRAPWSINNRVAGFWKQAGTLTHVVTRNTGHMVPHDNPLYGQMLIERWMAEAVEGRPYLRNVTQDMEDDWLPPDRGDVTWARTRYAAAVRRARATRKAQ